MVAIREYTPQEADQLEHCIAELQSFEKALDPNRMEAQRMAPAYREHLLTECEQHQGAIYLACVEGEAIGFICVLARMVEDELLLDHPEYAYITDLVVLPAYRGRGVGRALLERAEAYARQQGATVLKVDVLAANTNAREVYRRSGYAESEIRMQKPL